MIIKRILLAIGCYYFQNFSILNNSLSSMKIESKQNKEFYLIDILEKNLEQKKLIHSYLVKKFVHLGIPSQYEDFLLWQKYFLNSKKNS